MAQFKELKEDLDKKVQCPWLHYTDLQVLAAKIHCQISFFF